MGKIKGRKMGLQEVSEIACIHGRFQPFHNGHVDYLKAALSHWPKIIIGLTAVTPVKNVSKLVEHRADAVANPFSYWERMTLIDAGLKDIGVSVSDVSYVPFPIDQPENLKFIIPKSTICATTNLCEWNREKVNRLNSVGYSTHILDECIKVDFDGSKIRSQIIEGNPEWKMWVPPSSVELLELWDVRSRLISLTVQST
jgi:cytidyltransferase-like protein